MTRTETMALLWYDDLSKEGLFQDTRGERVFANFELEDFSHLIASIGKRGTMYSVEVVRDTTFNQVARLNEMLTP